MRIIDCEQGTPEWHAARAGIPTASNFSAVLANGRGGEASKTRRSYMLKLAGERLTGEVMESPRTHHMERGTLMEAEARGYYGLLTGIPPSRVGFIRNDLAGCSPDSLVGDRGMLEIKTALPHILIDLIIKGEFPPEHKPQVQGQLWIAERDWVDLAVYWPSLPPFIQRAHRDDAYIEKLAQAILQFSEELEGVVARVKTYVATGADA